MCVGGGGGVVCVGMYDRQNNHIGVSGGEVVWRVCIRNYT